ncbi:hypothetical protein SJDPG12_00450 [Porphyromonas gingivalis SJD12]|nr:hypothetical protein SJDPG12_00450 [Porphyromonas gingivalis SJD12]
MTQFEQRRYPEKGAQTNRSIRFPSLPYDEMKMEDTLFSSNLG